MNIIIVDDHRVFSDALKFMLEHKTSHHVLSTLDSVVDLRSRISHCEVDCILLDYHMPDADSLLEASYIRKKYPNIKIVFLTGTQSGYVLTKIVKSNVNGVLHKEDQVEEIVTAIELILSGERFVSKTILQKLPDKNIDLTEREFQTLGFLMKGLSSKEIADKMSISNRTVDKHKENIMKKLNVTRGSQLLTEVHRLGLFQE